MKKTRPLRACVYTNKSNRSNAIYIKWKDLKTGKIHTRTTGGNDEEVASIMVQEKKDELSEELLSEEYDTNINRIKKFSEILERETENSLQRKLKSKPGSSLGKSLNIAAKEAGVAVRTIKLGMKVLAYAESKMREGDIKAGKRILYMLNDSIEDAYRELPECARNLTSGVPDTVIKNAMYNLARFFDNKVNVTGGSDYRDQCIEILKQLSAKYDEWRASE